MFLKPSALFAAFIFIVLSFGSRAQKLTQFANDTNKFTRDFGQYIIENTVNKEHATEFVRNFEKLWSTNVIAGYFKETSIKTANTMLAKRFKPYPYFFLYFNTLTNAIGSGQIGE